MTIPTPEQILGQIAEPGRMLAFCDETDLTKEATSTMVAEIHAWVALLIPSARYAAVSAAVLDYQQAHGLPELHGNEIVTPGKASAWRPVTIEKRLDAYRFACDLIASEAADVRYVHMSEAQYADLVAAHPEEELPAKHKTAVKAVFKSCIAEQLADHAPAILVFDKDKNNAGPSLEPIPGAAHLVGGGVLRERSDLLPGLQLADIAAYAVGRYLRRRDAIPTKGAKGFDNIAIELVETLDGRFSTLLRPTPLAA